MDDKKLELSYSRISTFLGCRKRYWWIYEQDLVPKVSSMPLMVGDIVHRLLDAYYRGTLMLDDLEQLNKYCREVFPNNDPEELAQVASQAAQLFVGYVRYFKDDGVKVVSPEMHLRKDYGDFTLYSRLDGMAILPSQHKFRMEHKTAGRLDSAYLRGLQKGLQTGIAHWLLQDLFEEQIKGTLYNIIVKTEVPQYERSPVFTEPWVIDFAKETVYGCVRSIQRGDLYPSMNCFTYNSECSHLPLCRSDTPRTREELYTSRKEVMDRVKTIGARINDDVDAYQPKTI